MRDALYLPALVTIRFNPNLKAKHEHLRAVGKPAKVANMRNVIEMANTVVKAGRNWIPRTV